MPKTAVLLAQSIFVGAIDDLLPARLTERDDLGVSKGRDLHRSVAVDRHVSNQMPRVR